MTTVDVSKLAQDRGCTLKVMLADDSPIYWVENSVFIGRPYSCLDELIRFIQILPIGYPAPKLA
jgi:hypothetical protein